jgi:hypothetical protein
VYVWPAQHLVIAFMSNLVVKKVVYKQLAASVPGFFPTLRLYSTRVVVFDLHTVIPYFYTRRMEG